MEKVKKKLIRYSICPSDDSYIDSVVMSAYNSEKAKDWGEKSIHNGIKPPKHSVGTEENLSFGTSLCNSYSRYSGINSNSWINSNVASTGNLASPDRTVVSSRV